MNRKNIAIIQTIADALGELRDRVVFVGGITTELYSDNLAAPEPRPTYDVDVIIEVISYIDYTELEKALRLKGFVNDQSEQTNICRWIFKDILVDVMPTSGKTLGFTNEWYSEAIANPNIYQFDKHNTIRILDTPYFFATKLSALKSRGISDLRYSKDFEDLIFVIMNKSSVVDDIHNGPGNADSYISESFRYISALDIFEEAISCVLGPGEPAESTDRAIRLIKKIIR